MSGYDIATLVAAVVVAAAAAWTAWFSPKAKQRELAVQQQLDFHRDWNGWSARPGVPAQPGVMERLARAETALSAPILNGRGERMIDDIEVVKTSVELLGSRLTGLERRHDDLEQWLENRFAEQITVIGEALGPVD